MGKLCPRGKAAAKRRFKVYPSAYANMYASAVCSGKITPGGKKGSKKKKAVGGSVSQQRKMVSANRMEKGGLNGKRTIQAAGCGMIDKSKRRPTILNT